MSKPKAPKPPDVGASIERQMDLNTQVMDTNRYGQVTPYASNQWVTDPVTGKVNNVTAFSPEQQALYTANNALQQKLAGMGGTGADMFASKYYGGGGGAPAPGYTGSAGPVAGTSSPSGISYSSGGSAITPTGGGGYALNSTPGVTYRTSTKGGPDPSTDKLQGGIYGFDKASGVGGVGSGIQKELDYSKLTAMPTVDEAARQQVQDALYGRSASYLDPQMQAQQQSLETKLSNQGLVPGTTAYNRAYAAQKTAEEQAYANARREAIIGGGDEQARQLQMGLALRNQGVTEAGNLGQFHNAAQAQRAGQLLTDVGQQRQLAAAREQAAATTGAAGISAAAQQNIAAQRLGLDTRSQEFNELMAYNKATQPMIPQFGISQGNMAAAPNALGAEMSNYQNQMAQYNANKGSGLGGMLPMIGQVAGTAFGGPLGTALGGMAGTALSGMFGGGGLQTPAAGWQ